MCIVHFDVIKLIGVIFLDKVLYLYNILEKRFPYIPLIPSYVLGDTDKLTSLLPIILVIEALPSNGYYKSFTYDVVELFSGVMPF